MTMRSVWPAAIAIDPLRDRHQNLASLNAELDLERRPRRMQGVDWTPGPSSPNEAGELKRALGKATRPRPYREIVAANEKIQPQKPD